MGADNQGYLAVEGVGVGHFLAAGLGVDVGNDGLDRGAQPVF